MEHKGFILIADITGYTTYLSESELEHAKGTLTDLLELLIEHTRPPLVISRLEGDAVFSYSLGEGLISAQTFLESIEDTYVSFRHAIELMVINNTCRCNACANVSSLDLKFFIHHGTFAVQKIGDHEELMGSDVNLIHRLLKNSVTADTGIRAYVLCTDAAERQLGLEAATDHMVSHVEQVPDFGEVKVWIKDMHPVFEARRGQQEVTYTESEVLGGAETKVSMSPEMVWDYVNQTEFRDILVGSDHHEVTDRKAGLIGEGSIYQCYHGKHVIPQVVMEWRPFQRIVLRQQLALPGKPAFLDMDIRLTSSDGGTRLSTAAARPSGSLVHRLLTRLMVRLNAKRAQRDLESFRDQIETDLAAKGGAPTRGLDSDPGALLAERPRSLSNVTEDLARPRDDDQPDV